MHPSKSLLALFVLVCACGDNIAATVEQPDAGGDAPAPIEFAQAGSISAAQGKGSFGFGVATAATQIEGSNPGTDWDVFAAPAPVGLGLSVAEWRPARNNLPSDDPEDMAAAERVEYIFHHLFVESLRQGAFDPDLDTSYERTATEGATVLGDIARSRRVSSEQRTLYGGLGPMTAEAE